MDQGRKRIGIIGLGYVGLPLAILFSRLYAVIGYDQSSERIHELVSCKDVSGEVTEEDLREVQNFYTKENEARGLFLTLSPDALATCDIFIVAVPTPVDERHLPDLSFLFRATELVAGFLKKGDLVIYESTVFPGCTEEQAIPLLEKISGLQLNDDFGVGYSPERINPGDKQRRLQDIIKLTSGSSVAVADQVNRLYAAIIPAGTFPVSSIRIAEAAKVVENTQRDVNIAYMNELSKVFRALQIDLSEVLEAASTKWNFLPFHPGLVGGHCIGVDPYYLIHRSLQAGYDPALLRSARGINDSMGEYVANRFISLLRGRQIELTTARVLILGVTFKANTPDIRNSRVFELIKTLRDSQIEVDVVDPLADTSAVKSISGCDCFSAIQTGVQYQGIVVAVSHTNFADINFTEMLATPSVVFDLQGLVSRGKADETL